VDQGSTNACVPESWSLVGPSLIGTAIETMGLALGLLGLGGLKKKFFDLCPLYGKRVWSTWEGEPSGAILVGKDRDHGRVSRDVTRRCVVGDSGRIDQGVISDPSRVRL